MVIGGFIMQSVMKTRVEQIVTEYCSAQGVVGEIKWKKTNRNTIERFTQLVDKLQLLTIGAIQYKSLVIDTWNIDHKTYNFGSSIVGYHKFLYYLVVRKFGRVIGPLDKLYVRVDKQTEEYDYAELARIMNNGFRKDYAQVTKDIVIEVSSRDSKNCRLTQISDLITGGLRFAINRPIIERRGKAEKEKYQLSEYICAKWGITEKYLRSPFASTPWRKTDFEIWHFNLKPKSTLIS
jgi:hypothetical protein